MAPSPPSPLTSPARLLWDAGGVWSLMAWQALSRAGLRVRPISAAQIRQGQLDEARLLMVPGGWSSLKKQALGPQGCGAVREFVQKGGFYLGLCGGAGLALDVKDGLGLLPLGRVSGQARLSAISGPVMVEPGPHTPPTPPTPLWQGLQAPLRFQVWWPGQFALPQDDQVSILARYQGAAPGLCTSDLEADQVGQDDWPGLEASYGCNLDPARLKGLPAVLGRSYGRGRLLVSYLHFDTPDDPNGARVLGNIWHEVLGELAQAPPGDISPEAAPALSGLARQAAALWQKGQDLGLWQPRQTPSWFPLWKRNSRGLEFFSLYRLVNAVARLAGDQAPSLCARLEPVLSPVFEKGGQVLAAQKACLQEDDPPGPACKAHAQWFPRPRRMGGDLARAMQELENALQSLLLVNSVH